METITLSYPLSEDIIARNTRAQVMAIGQFDGLHLGHNSVIKSAVDLAANIGLPSAVMTFHPHPKEVMKKGDYDGYLTPPHEKEQLLREMGVDYLYIVDFNDAFSQVSPHDFVCGMLLPLQVHTAVVGFDFRYGYRGEGHASTLREWSGNAMEVNTVPAFLIDGEKVSSSGIRKALQEGDVALADRWLGRRYKITGSVMHGEKRGRLLGFPTANMKPNEHFVLPAKGVYAVSVNVEGKCVSGVMNVGVKPTFHSDVVAPSLEIHLLDFNDDLYGKMLEVELVEFIREEHKFESIEKLIAQITRDAESARKLLLS
ncbi:riboflavin kinase/FMN adenylyltransferase [Paenibacillus anaericanus]|uniref:Riboflavin biosynthesis protein n=1 Tax=Paenibacillus anaericanus TaxID=170367 RepID=A0A3S1DQM2_9BACL|nr:bifunctional riboflavin kinase/FAD synthetase [Paenibacillus anaericanus]MDQ0090575.1 riboflavin kinase/FMN adenylyltransferase [Paenibacillus anaericanus]RUT46856.1 bifunctional riboflavin kinase/FAD synthetase [Paenibacillus anaericanus]